MIIISRDKPREVIKEFDHFPSYREFNMYDKSGYRTLLYLAKHGGGGGGGQPTNITSTTLSVGGSGYNRTVNLKTQPTAYAITNVNGLLDVKIDNSTIIRSSGGVLTAVGGGSGTGAVNSVSADDSSLTINPVTGNVKAKAAISATSGNALQLKTDGLYVSNSGGGGNYIAGNGIDINNNTISAITNTAVSVTNKIATMNDVTNAGGGDVSSDDMVDAIYYGLEEVFNYTRPTGGK